MKETSTGLSRNLAATLAYLFGFVSGILFLLIEKDGYVRFHAMQSTILFGGYFALNWVLPWVPIVDVIWLLISIPLSLVIFILWIYLMYQAWQGRMYKLPVVGEWSEKALGKVKVGP